MPVLSPAAHPTRRRRVVVLVNRLNRGWRRRARRGGGRDASAARPVRGHDRHHPSRPTGRCSRPYSPAGVRHVALGRRSRFGPVAVPAPALAAAHRADRHRPRATCSGPTCGAPCSHGWRAFPSSSAHEHTWSYEGSVRPAVARRPRHRAAESTAFVAVSERDGDRMVTLEGVSRDKIVVLPNPFLRRPNGDGGGALEALDRPHGAPLGGDRPPCCGPRRRLRCCSTRSRRSSPRFPGRSSRSGATGSARGALEEHARELGIARSRARFLGWWQDVEGPAPGGGRRGDQLQTTRVLRCSRWSAWPIGPRSSAPMSATSPSSSAARGVLLVAPARFAGDGPRDHRAPARSGAAPRAQARAAAERLPRFEIENVTRRFVELYERLLATQADGEDL